LSVDRSGESCDSTLGVDGKITFTFDVSLFYDSVRLLILAFIFFFDVSLFFFFFFFFLTGFCNKNKEKIKKL
jgi:hypothetical protein